MGLENMSRLRADLGLDSGATGGLHPSNGASVAGVCEATVHWTADGVEPRQAASLTSD